MKLKILLKLLVLFAVSTSVTSSLYASTPERLVVLFEEILNVKEYLAGIGKPRLVMGMNNDSGKEAGRFTDNYIFLNITHDTTSNRNLSVNFNDLEELDLVSSGLENVFDMVVLDDSTFKFTSWRKVHLSHFKKMLKSGGQFVFGPSNEANGIDFSRPAAPAKKWLSKLENWLSRQMTLVTGFEVPYFFELEEGENADEVELQFLIHKKFQQTPRDKWRELQDDLKIDFLVSSELLKDSDDKIRDHIKKEVAIEKLSLTFFNDYVIPSNIMRIVNEVFGNSVLLEHNKPLPFKSNYKQKQEFLITATKL